MCQPTWAIIASMDLSLLHIVGMISRMSKDKAGGISFYQERRACSYATLCHFSALAFLSRCNTAGDNFFKHQVIHTITVIPHGLHQNLQRQLQDVEEMLDYDPTISRHAVVNIWQWTMQMFIYMIITTCVQVLALRVRQQNSHQKSVVASWHYATHTTQWIFHISVCLSCISFNFFFSSVDCIL